MGRNQMMTYNPFRNPSVYGMLTRMGSKKAQSTEFYQGGSKTMVTQKRRKKKYNKNSFRNKLMNTIPAKHYTVAASQAVMTHNTIYTMVPTQGVTQGDGNANRDGDSIDICALKLKGFAQTHSNASAYSYRILVGWSGEELSSLTNFGSGLGASEIFLPSTTDNWVLNGVVNPKAFTCVYDQTIDIGSQITGVVDLTSFSINVPFNTRFLYQSAASIQGKSRNLCVVIIAATAGGTTGSTNAGAIYAGADLIFKTP
jgi:hypothetical protein